MNNQTDYNILDFGAVGDGIKINTAAIQKAIDTCSKKGGGRVLIPKGTFATGTIELKSRVNLLLEQEGVLLGSPNKKDYPEKLQDDPDFNRSPHASLLFAFGAQDISISGNGTINGNARLDSQGDFRDTGNNVNRPPLTWLVRCTNVSIKDTTFRQSLMYTVVCESCKNVHVDHITITENYFYNADGIDIIDCEDFLVENCDINCDDDGICLKSGIKTGCRRGVVRKNKVRSLCNAIKFGTGSSGGFWDITIEDNEVWQTGISGLALEIVDGGVMDNITIRDITMNGVCTPINFRLGNRNKSAYKNGVIMNGILRNVHISNIKATVNKPQKFNEAERAHHDYAAYASSICGISGNYVENVTLENIDITITGGFPVATIKDSLREIPEVSNKYPENRMFGVLPSWGFYIRHARGIKMNNIRVSIAQEDGRPAFVLDDVHEARFENVQAKGITSTPLLSVYPGCTGVQMGRQD